MSFAVDEQQYVAFAAGSALFTFAEEDECNLNAGVLSDFRSTRWPRCPGKAQRRNSRRG